MEMIPPVFGSSSAAERSTVNRMVVGSIPTSRAIKNTVLDSKTNALQNCRALVLSSYGDIELAVSRLTETTVSPNFEFARALDF
jgi:hypothetical protein